MPNIPNLKIGDTRTFEFTQDIYEIIQILRDTKTQMDYVWNKHQCPYCNREFGDKKIHVFNYIEVMLPQPINQHNKIENIILLGFSDDERTILITPKLPELKEKIDLLKEKEV
jgi:hypothetical protein